MTEAPHAPPIRTFDVFASLIVAYELAFAQPLLDLLGRNAEFFVARSSPRSDILAVVVGVGIVVPLLGAGAVLLVRALHRGTGHALHLFGIGSLFALLALQLLRRGPGAGAVQVAGAVLVGVLCASAYFRLPSLRRVFRILVPLPVLVVGLALAGSQLSKLVFDDDVVAAGVPGAVIGEPAPVVLVSFDEFPLATLLDERDRIDAKLFPNFAKLAGTSTWFRNTTGVGEFTDKAQPPIVTGYFPDNEKLPIVADHPLNLFTLLGRSYDVVAQEPITRLCPLAVCGKTAPRVSSGPRWRSLLSDLRVLVAHMVLPDDFTESLPPIDQGWGNFDAQARGGLAKKYSKQERAEALRANFHAAVDQDRRASFDAFLASIRPRARPALYYSHVILPHGPFEFLPSGHNYPLAPGLPGRSAGSTWVNDDWLVAQAYKHHVLQTQYTDLLVGRLIARLQRQGLFDSAVVVITADHGGSFVPGTPRRSASAKTIADIAAVPLFIKKPGQRSGAIDDRPIYTMDVLPTIADILGVDGLWKTDGSSAYRVDAGSRPTKRLIRNNGTVLTFPATLEMLKGVVARKYRVFARDGASIDPWRTEPYGGLLGRPLTGFSVTGGPGGSIAPPAREDGGGPNVLTGTTSVGDGLYLALTIDGVFRGITRTDGRRFGFLVPEGSVKRGSALQVFVIEASRLRRIAGATSSY